MARTSENNIFKGNEEMALEAIAAASRLLLEMSSSATASEMRKDIHERDRDNFGATFGFLGSTLYDAHEVMYDNFYKLTSGEE